MPILDDMRERKGSRGKNTNELDEKYDSDGDGGTGTDVYGDHKDEDVDKKQREWPFRGKKNVCYSRIVRFLCLLSLKIPKNIPN